MTLAEMNTILTGITGYADKVAYYAFPESGAPALPFIVFFETAEDGFAADGINYHQVRNISVELYTKNRNTAEESKVEAALTTAGIFYQKEIDYIDDEKCYVVHYAMEV